MGMRNGSKYKLGRKLEILIQITIFLIIICIPLKGQVLNRQLPWLSYSLPELSTTQVNSNLVRLQINALPLSSYYTLYICNQEEFDRLSSRLSHSLSQGIKNIRICLEPGSYEYIEAHIKLSELDSTCNILIDGNESIIVSQSTPVSHTKNLNFIYSINDRPIEAWSETFQANEVIHPTDDDNIFKLKLVPEADVEVGDLIKVSQWYLSSIYKISKVDEDYMYFSTDYPYSLNRYNWDKSWSMNEDVRYGQAVPRFRVYRPSGDDNLKEHRTTCFIDIRDSNINSLKISNLNIWGSAYDKKKGVINLSNVSSKSIVVDNCSFSDCKSPCISLRGVDNVLIEECNFTDNYNTCIETDDRCVNASVVNNFFKGNGRDWYNYFDIIISGENFLVADNTLTDFTYGAIRVGNWWGLPKKGLVTGTVENNLIYYTPDFYANYQKYTLMDSGAIYINTINDDVHIRYNRIYNIAGMKNYRGIFGDDGTCNAKIYGNVITGIKDSYAIDLRYVPSIEKKEKYAFGRVNVGNVLIDNFVDGDIRFEGRKGDNDCVKGFNFFLEAKDGKLPESNTKNINYSEPDTTIPLIKTNNEFIVVIPQSCSQLESYPIYRNISKWIEVQKQ